MAGDPNTISTSSLPEPISPLRQRMIEDMTIRRLAPRTQAAYLSTVSRFIQSDFLRGEWRQRQLFHST